MPLTLPDVPNDWSRERSRREFFRRCPKLLTLLITCDCVAGRLGFQSSSAREVSIPLISGPGGFPSKITLEDVSVPVIETIRAWMRGGATIDDCTAFYLPATQAALSGAASLSRAAGFPRPFFSCSWVLEPDAADSDAELVRRIVALANDADSRHLLEAFESGDHDARMLWWDRMHELGYEPVPVRSAEQSD